MRKTSLLDKSNERPSLAKLISQNQIREAGKSWHRTVFNDIESRLGGDTDFPCIFGRNAFRKQLLRFIFVETIEASGIQHLAEGLKEYVDISNDWDGNLGTAYPLVVAFSLDAIDAQSVDSYHTFGWKVIQKLHEIDPAPWPDEVAKDPHSPSWSMCFNGMPVFFNMSFPAHQIRKSRNLGEHFIFIINPRERFDVFAGDTPSGRKARSNIRNRIGRYDGASHCLQLASYGTGGIEWRQYGIIESNTERTDRCPFTFMKS